MLLFWIGVDDLLVKARGSDDHLPLFGFTFFDLADDLRFDAKCTA